MEINKIYNGDCLELMKQIEDNSIDIIITDPPYNFEVVGGAFKSENPSTSRDYLSKIIDGGYGKFNPDSFLKEAKRVLKKIRMVIFCNRFLIEKYIAFARENNLIFDIHIMAKNNPAPFKNNTYLSDIEYIMVIREHGTFFNKKSEFNDYRKFFLTNVRGDNLHPAQKPIEIIEKYIRVLSDEGDLILDPYIGSGTTAIACIKTNRNFIGIEMNKEYFKMSEDRIQKELSQSKLKIWH